MSQQRHSDMTLPCGCRPVLLKDPLVLPGEVQQPLWLDRRQVAEGLLHRLAVHVIQSKGRRVAVHPILANSATASNRFSSLSMPKMMLEVTLPLPNTLTA